MQFPAIWHSIFGSFIFNEVSAGAGQFTAGTAHISAS
jgi:hypothetical protein